MLSYAKWDEYEIRMPVYVDGHKDYDNYDIVKWEDHEPQEVTDWVTGEKKMSTRCCFTIAMLRWDKKNLGFRFESCHTRYLEDRKDGLEKFILTFIAAETYKRTGAEE